MIPAFPKIFAVGSEYIPQLFQGEVEVTEKVDGSQFAFGVINGELECRSKGAVIHPDAPPKMFEKAVETAQSIRAGLPDGWVFYCEFLNSPKHNVLRYLSPPVGYLALFGIHMSSNGFCANHDILRNFADNLGIDAVPLLYRGKVEAVDQLLKFLEMESYLKGPKIEGVVVKNYSQPFLLGGQPIPIMMGKYVSEAFKEIHRKNWSAENTGRGRWDVYKSQFATPARWEKAVQHLRDKGELEGSPRDIGKLMKEVFTDIEAEEKQAIMNCLWNEFGKDLLRTSTHGLPEWYKNTLAAKAFTVEEKQT